MKDKFTEISAGVLGVENKNDVTYSTEGFPDTKFVKNEDGTYTLSKQQLDHLSTGKLKFIEDRLYINGGSFTVTGEQTHPKPLMVIEPSLTESLNPASPIFIQPTESQKERFNKLSGVPEITGVNLKGSKHSDIEKIAIRGYIDWLEYISGKDLIVHPYEYLERASVFLEYSGDSEVVKRFLLETVNSLVPAKPGMRFTNFTMTEYELKYAHTTPTLLERTEKEFALNGIDGETHQDLGPLQVSPGDLTPKPFDLNDIKGVHSQYLSVQEVTDCNTKRKQELLGELEKLIDRLYYSNGDNPPVYSNIDYYRESVHIMFQQYIDQIDGESFNTNLLTALYMQNEYWDKFHGYTMTYIRYLVAILKNNDERYILNDRIVI